MFYAQPTSAVISERDRHTHTHTHTHTHRERETERDTHTETQTQRETHRHRERDFAPNNITVAIERLLLWQTVSGQPVSVWTEVTMAGRYPLVVGTCHTPPPPR